MLVIKHIITADEMVEFEFNITDLLMDRSSDLRTAAVTAIEDALVDNVDTAYIATIELELEQEGEPHLIGKLDLSLKEEQWSTFLEDTKKALIELEDYESIGRLDKLLTIL